MRHLPSRVWSFVVGCAVYAVAVTTLMAAEPQVSSISPVGFQRGKEIELTINGARLADAKELLFFSPGFTVAAIEGATDTSIKAKVTAAADLAPGIYAVRLRTATGVSNLKTITVGQLPDVQDVEPNNSFDKPQAIAVNSTVNGSIVPEDSDFFQVELKQGQRLNVEIEGLRLGNAYFDPFVAIYNEAKQEQVRSDDAPLLYSDSLCSLVAPADGKYLVLVRESAIGGQGGGYRLHIGTFPRPTAVFPPGGKPGETLQLRWIGDAGGDFTTAVTLLTDGRTEVPLFAKDDRGEAPSGNVVRVIDLPTANEVEPNDAPPQASPGVTGALQGIIERPGDVDHLKFPAVKGKAYDVRVFARLPLRSPLDSVLTVLNPAGAGVGSNDDTGNSPDSYLRFTAADDGEFVAVIRDQLGNGGPNFVYRIEVTEVKPQLTVTLPERVQYVANTLVIPKNNRMALMVSASRANFGADLTLEFPGLPPGVTAEPLPFVAGKNEIPVLFTAAADANPAGALPLITARSTDPNIPVTGQLTQRSMLIRGQNNRDVWGYTSDKLAVVVADEIPFKIEIVQPKAPLARSGSMDLKVVVTRAPEFKAPIALSFVYNPPGVASSISAVIPEGQNEGVIPLTANAQAAIGPWRIVVLGKSAHGNGSVEAASQFVDLNIVESFYTITLPKSTIEIGKENDLTATIEVKTPFEGNATAEIKGLPNGLTSAPVEFNKDAKEITFKLTSAADTRAGKYTTLVCVTTQKIAEETVTHTLANGEVRVDPPLPPKVGAPPPMATPAAVPMKKPASRLEQLRLEKKVQ